MGLLSFLFPSLRKPKPFFAPPSKPPLYKKLTRVWLAGERKWGSVVDVEPCEGQWQYAVDLDSHEYCRVWALERDLSLLETHPYWKP